MFHWLKKAEDRASFVYALESVIAGIASYYICFYLSSLYNFPLKSVSGLWGSISAFMVLGTTKIDVLKAALARIIASTVAAIVSLIVIYLLGFTPIGLAVALFVSVVVIALFKRKDIYRSTTITVAVIFVVGISLNKDISPWVDCATRYFESLIGVIVAIATVYLFHPIHHRIG